jgi:hypothetical protein
VVEAQRSSKSSGDVRFIGGTLRMEVP